jgi:signal transduction histidine kinase
VSENGSFQEHRSLRTVVAVALVSVSVVLAISLVGGTISFTGLLSSRGKLVDELDPAVAAAAALRAATGDQQSGVRGFSLTGDPDFLGPWDRGTRDAEQAVAALRSVLADRGGPLQQLELIVDDLRRWQVEHAEPAIEAAEAGFPTSTDAYAESRLQFNEVRSLLDGLVEQLGEQRAQARDDLDEATSRMVLTLGVVALTLALLIAAVAIGLRRFVLAPVDEMVADAERIAGGDLDHVPAAAGFSELAALGRSLDSVRTELVSKLREAEEREVDLARSNAELEQFAYVASHDLQEPLRKVASFCQMLERRYKGQLDERADTYIAFAVDGAKRMQELINDLLAFSRVGRTTERFELVDLDEALDLALRNLSAAIDESGGTVSRSPLPTVVGDRSLLVALFQNLIGNGLKFRAEAPPTVDISARDLGEGCWEFCVSDNGIGIPEEYRDRIFVIFQRLHSRAEYAGTGIGLSLCRKIVEFHGGRIEVDDSSEAPGTTIRFTLRQDLPLDAAMEPQKVTRP